MAIQNVATRLQIKSLVGIVILFVFTKQCFARPLVGRSKITANHPTVSRRSGTQKQNALKRGKPMGNHITAENLYAAYQEIQHEYQSKAFVSKGWQILSKTKDGVEIALLKTASDPACPYIRITATLPARIAETWQVLSLSNWDVTMRKINPFYDGLEIIGEYAKGPVKMTVARKRTKRIFAFGRRDFGLVSVSDVPRKDGVWVSGTVSLETPQLPRQRGYVRAFQDSISFYKPMRDQNGKEITRLTMICRTDLNDSTGAGGWVPMWLYIKTIGKSGTQAMQGLRQLLEEA